MKPQSLKHTRTYIEENEIRTKPAKFADEYEDVKYE